MMFRGHFEHAIDAKGRTSLPARFRHVLTVAGDLRLVLTPGLSDPAQPYLDAYPMAAWEQFEAQVAKQKKWDPDIVLLRRRYVSAAVECEIDRQGRVLVPPSLREHAGLSKQVLWAGVGTMMEAVEEPELARWRQVIAEKLDL
jgi:MraZ protein